jgi:hypothetical protein
MPRPDERTRHVDDLLSGHSRSLVPDPQAEFHFGRSDRACRGDHCVRALMYDKTCTNHSSERLPSLLAQRGARGVALQLHWGKLAQRCIARAEACLAVPA